MNNESELLELISEGVRFLNKPRFRLFKKKKIIMIIQ